MGSTKYPKTVKAIAAEESSAWAVVDALTDELELDGDSNLPHGAIVELVAELSSVGLEKEPTTVSNYAHAARMLQIATPSQRAAFRNLRSCFALGLVGRAGVSPKALEAEIGESSDFGYRRARALVAELNRKKRGEVEPKPVDYDAQLQSLSSRIVDTLTEAGDLEPMTLAYLNMMAKAVLSITGDEVAILDEVDEGLRAMEEFLRA